MAVVWLLAVVGCGGGPSNSNKDGAFDVPRTGGRPGSGGLSGTASGGFSGAAGSSGSGGVAAASGGGSGNSDAGGGATTGADASSNDDGAGREVMGSSTGGGGGFEAGGAPATGGASAGGGASGAGVGGGAADSGSGGRIVGGPNGGGASGATGGSSGSGGMGGGEGGCFPACLDALVQSCPTTGACTYAVSLNPIGANVCFSNGVKAQNATAPLTTSTVKNANGNPCYTVETTAGNAGVGYVWKSPAGATVATATVASAAMNTMIVMCDGSTTVVDLNATNCSGQSIQPLTTTCTLGTCVF